MNKFNVKVACVYFIAAYAFVANSGWLLGTALIILGILNLWLGVN